MLMAPAVPSHVLSVVVFKPGTKHMKQEALISGKQPGQAVGDQPPDHILTP